MILTDTDIIKFRQQGRLGIEPWNSNQLGTNSYDLTLDNTLLIYTDPVLDVKSKNQYEYIDIPTDGYVLQPGELYLANTRETTFSHNVVPLMEGKASLGRLGLSVHITAGFGDCGFSGSWTLEMTVVKPLRIYAGISIAQIYFILPVSTPRVPYNMKISAKYNHQDRRPVPSMMWKNFEEPFLEPKKAIWDGFPSKMKGFIK